MTVLLALDPEPARAVWHSICMAVQLMDDIGDIPADAPLHGQRDLLVAAAQRLDHQINHATEHRLSARVLLCEEPTCQGEFYLPLDRDELPVCPVEPDHPVAVYKLDERLHQCAGEDCDEQIDADFKWCSRHLAEYFRAMP